MRILGVDPGHTQSAIVLFDEDIIRAHGIIANSDLITTIRGNPELHADVLLIEKIASYGMPVGEEVFETVFWSGQFAEAWHSRFGLMARVERMTRNDVKMMLCHRTAKVNDSVIRQRLIDIYGGKERAVGRKASPGPLYGIRADEWAALALVKAWLEQRKER